MKTLKLLSKPSFEAAKKSARLRSIKNNALYLVMSNGKDKHNIIRMPDDVKIIHTIDGRKKRLEEIVPAKQETKSSYMKERSRKESKKKGKKK